MRPDNIKIHVRKLQKLIEKARRKAEKAKMQFVALSEEEIIAKLMRTNSPILFSWMWDPSVPPGGTMGILYWVYNPDHTKWDNLYALAFVGPNIPGYVTLLDDRFSRLTQPKYPGLSLSPSGASVVSFSVKVPSQIDSSNYQLNLFLFQLVWYGGFHLDTSTFIFAVQ